MTDDRTDGPSFDSEALLDSEAALHDFNADVVARFRADDGRVGGDFEGMALVLLHSTGAKSGATRVSPLAYLSVAGKTLIVGSKAGAPKHPAWVHNLRAHPRAHVEIATADGIDEYDVTARELPEDERAHTFTEIAAISPVFAGYQAKTSRTIPIFELVRTA